LFVENESIDEINSELLSESDEDNSELLSTISYAVTGGNISFNTSTGLISSADSSVTEATIPSSIEGRVVLGIGDKAFQYNTNLRSVTISNGISSIGYNAFYNCTSLRTVNLNNDLETIGSGAFYNCTSSKSIVIPASVTTIDNYYSGRNYEYYGVFQGCKNLTTVTIKTDSSKKSLYLGSHAFYNCTALTSVDLSDRVTNLGKQCFYNCYSLKQIKLPTSLTTYESDAFQLCKSLAIYGTAKQCSALSANYSYIKTVVTEVINPPTIVIKNATGGKSLTFDCDRSDAKIYFTVSKNSKITTSNQSADPGDTYLCNAYYYGPVYAKVYSNGAWSAVKAVSLRVNIVPAPTIEKSTNGKTKIKSKDGSALIYYTTDGSTPSRTNYAGKFWGSRDIKIAKGTTVKALAVRSSFVDSSVTTQTISW
jgi:hypothetical protein